MMWFRYPTRYAFLYALLSLLGAVLFVGPLHAGSTSSSSQDVRKAAAKAIPATAHVEWTLSGAEKKGDEGEIELMQTSGAVVSADGLVVSVYDGDPHRGRFSVTLSDGRRRGAKLLVVDRRSGLCLLKIDARELDYLTLVEQPVEIGQPVAAAYCVSAKDRAVARGIVTRKSALVSFLPTHLLQTDVRAEKMSAGAPLVDMQGRLAGILLARRGAAADGISFAVPASLVAGLLKTVRPGATVEVHAGFLGVHLASEDPKQPTRITTVHPQSPAAAAGLQVGDVLIRIGDQKVDSVAEVLAAIASRGAGSTVRVEFLREGDKKSAEVKLGRRQVDSAVSSSSGLRIERVQPGDIRVLLPDGQRSGVATAALTRALKELAKSNPDAVRSVQATDAKALGNVLRAQDFLLRQQGKKVEGPVIRVQRSDTDKKLDDLNKQVDVLRRGLEELSKQVETLRKDLKND